MPSSPESVTSKYGLFILAEGRSNPSPEILEVHEIDIVAVHGLNGDAHRTWTSTGKGKGALWLRDFLPSFLPSARIMTFGYNSKIINPSGNNIEDDSRELLLRVLLSRRAGGINQHRPIIFIAHSLGGLVVKQALVLAQNIPEYHSIKSATRAIIFMGTPHSGSKIASKAAFMSNILRATGLGVAKHRIQALASHSDTLFRITEMFRHLAPQMKIVSFYETLPTPGLNALVVDRDSATLGYPGEVYIALQANHRDLCRFHSSNDEKLFQVVLSEIMRLTKEVSLELNLQTLDTTAPISNPSERHFIVPEAENAMFTGRVELLAQIHTMFKASIGKQGRIALIGFGGVGKTQIATAFAYESYASTKYTAVFWIAAHTPGTLQRSFTGIAKRLQLTGNAKSSSTSTPDIELTPNVEAVKEWLSATENKDWLLIFDNVDDLESMKLSNFFPCVSHGNILITSRRQIASRFGSKIDVDVLDDDEAIKLLLRCSFKNDPTQSEFEDARCLVQELGNLPLAIDQAGAYIAELDVEIRGYHAMFNTARGSMLGYKPPRGVWEYEHTTSTTWELSYDMAEKLYPLSARLLDIAAYFGSDDLPLEQIMNLSRNPSNTSNTFLTYFVPFVQSHLDLEDILGRIPQEYIVSEAEIFIALGKLISLSLVKRKMFSNSVTMHPIVHSWLKHRHENTRRRIELAQVSINLVSRAMFNACDQWNFGSVAELYPQAFICISSFEDTPELFDLIKAPQLYACSIATSSWVSVSVDDNTLQKADTFLQLLQRHNEAGSECEIPPSMLFMQRAKRLLSENRRKECMAVCGEFFSVYKPSDRSESMYGVCMAQIYTCVLYRNGDHDHVRRIFSQSNTDYDTSGYWLARKNVLIGSIDLDEGKLDNAESLLSSCISIFGRNIGRKHFLWDVCHYLLAMCYLLQGRLPEATLLVEPQILRAMESHERGKNLLRFSDYELAEVYARILRKEKRFREATSFIERLLVISSSSNPTPARSLADLSSVIIKIDHLVCLAEESKRCYCSNTRRTFESLLVDAREAFQKAADAYDLEWARGTWVFKSFDVEIQGYQARLENPPNQDKTQTTDIT